MGLWLSNESSSLIVSPANLGLSSTSRLSSPSCSRWLTERETYSRKSRIQGDALASSAPLWHLRRCRSSARALHHSAGKKGCNPRREIISALDIAKIDANWNYCRRTARCASKSEIALDLSSLDRVLPRPHSNQLFGARASSMAFRLKHHTVDPLSPLVESVTTGGQTTGDPSLDSFQGWALKIPDSLILAPHSCIFLQPSSNLVSATGDFNWPVVIANCKTTARLTALLVGHDEVSSQYKEHLEFLSAGKKDLVIDIIIFDVSGGPWDHFEADLPRLGADHRLTFTTRYKDAGTATAFSVAKTSIAEPTPIITMYHPTPQLSGSTPEDQDEFCLPFKILVAIEIAAHAVDHPSIPPPMWCKYDGTSRTSRLPILSDRARDAVKASRRKKHISPHSDPAGAWAGLSELMAEAQQSKNDGRQGRVTLSARLLAQLGPFCTVCASKHKLSRCAGCHVDYYCPGNGTITHQAADWEHHKAWYVVRLLSLRHAGADSPRDIGARRIGHQNLPRHDARAFVSCSKVSSALRLISARPKLTFRRLVDGQRKHNDIVLARCRETWCILWRLMGIEGDLRGAASFRRDIDSALFPASPCLCSTRRRRRTVRN